MQTIILFSSCDIHEEIRWIDFDIVWINSCEMTTNTTHTPIKTSFM